jgi:hypothetical protein
MSNPLSRKEVDFGFVDDTDLLHRLAQVRRLGEPPRAVQIPRFGQQNRVVGTAKKMLLRQAGLDTLREVSIVPSLPFRKVPCLVANHHVAGHRSLVSFLSRRPG